MRETLTAIHERERSIARGRSLSTAQLGLIAYGMAGGKKDITLDQLLPYPEDTGDRLSPRTAHIIDELLRDDKLPIQVVQAMGPYLDELERIVGE